MKFGASTGVRVQAKNCLQEMWKRIPNGWIKPHLKREIDLQVVKYMSVKVMASASIRNVMNAD